MLTTVAGLHSRHPFLYSRRVLFLPALKHLRCAPESGIYQIVIPITLDPNGPEEWKMVDCTLYPTLFRYLRKRPVLTWIKPSKFLIPSLLVHLTQPPSISTSSTLPRSWAHPILVSFCYFFNHDLD